MDILKLKGKIAEKGKTQTDLAKKLNLSVQSFNAKLNGRAKFDIDEAKKPRFLVVKERINFEIMKVLEAEGIELYTNNIRIKNFDPEILNGRKNEEKKYIKEE